MNEGKKNDRVDGKVRYRDYEHQGQKRWVTEIWASGFEMLGSPDKQREQQPERPSRPGPPVDQGQVNDLPF